MSSQQGGNAMPVVERLITQEQIARYAGASGDNNPLHLDPEFASGTQFGGIIAHGMLTLAYISEMLTLAFGHRWLEGGRLKVRLKAAARPGDVVRTWGKVVKDGHGDTECSIGISNDREELISGTATLPR